jgi:uncharacterized protein
MLGDPRERPYSGVTGGQFALFRAIARIRIGHLLKREAIRALSLQLGSSLLFFGAPTPAAHADGFSEATRAFARQDYSHSASLLLPRAQQGDSNAQTYIGVMYLRGEGVPQDFNAAAHWLHLAAKSGVPTAQYFLGLMYDKGQGVQQDFVLAQAWLNLAVAHAEAGRRDRWRLIRDAIAAKMSLAQLVEARRLAFEWRATSPR